MAKSRVQRVKIDLNFFNLFHCLSEGHSALAVTIATTTRKTSKQGMERMLILSLISEERGTSPKRSGSRVQWIIIKYSKTGNSMKQNQGFSDVGFERNERANYDREGPKR